MFQLILEAYQASKTTSNLFLRFYLLTMNLQTLLQTKKNGCAQKITMPKSEKHQTQTVVGKAKNIKQAKTPPAPKSLVANNVTTSEHVGPKKQTIAS